MPIESWPGRHHAVTIGSILNDFAQEEGPTRYQDEQKVTVAGIVSAHKTKTTRNNTLMAYVTLEDDSGSMELLVFSRVLGESGSYIRDNSPILVSGKISVRDEKEPQILCDSIRPLAELEETTVPEEEAGSSDLLYKGNKLYIKIPCADDVRMKKIRAILGMFPGESQAILYLKTRQTVGYPLCHLPLLGSRVGGAAGRGMRRSKIAERRKRL